MYRSFAKRAVDVAAATVLLVALSPVLALTAVSVRLFLGGPVLFRQTRPGYMGNTFTLVKFRTMKQGPGSDADRMTRFGSILRASSLDELPELWNVLRGEMSLVGPRPLLVEYLPLYSPRQATRHSVRPGITGLAQVSGRNAIGWAERLELDAIYAETLSFRSDVKILVCTIGRVVARDGISEQSEATVSAFEGQSMAPSPASPQMSKGRALPARGDKRDTTSVGETV